MKSVNTTQLHLEEDTTNSSDETILSEEGFRIKEYDKYYQTGTWISAKKEYNQGRLELPDKVITEILEAMREYTIGLTEEDAREETILTLLDDIEHSNAHYRPPVEEIDTALRCQLIPFYHDGDFYLADVDIGRDTTPLTDAYQALTDGTLPKESYFITDRDYCEFLLDKKTVEEALDRCRR